MLPDPIQNLIFALERLPGIGPKTASRLAFFLLRAPEEVSGSLAEALTDIKTRIAFCQECFNITTAGRERCEICESSQRDGALICVVEEPLDVLALERISAYKGKYHILQGVLSPIDGIGPDLREAGDINVRDAGKFALRLADGPAHDFDAIEAFARGEFEDLVEVEFRKDGGDESEFHS